MEKGNAKDERTGQAKAALQVANNSYAEVLADLRSQLKELQQEAGSEDSMMSTHTIATHLESLDSFEHALKASLGHIATDLNRRTGESAEIVKLQERSAEVLNPVLVDLLSVEVGRLERTLARAKELVAAGEQKTLTESVAALGKHIANAQSAIGEARRAPSADTASSAIQSANQHLALGLRTQRAIHVVSGL